MAHKGFLAGNMMVGLAGLALALIIALALAPSALGPLGVTAWFLLLLVGLTGMVASVVYLIAAKLQPKRSAKQRQVDAVRRGLFVSGYGVIMLALSSLQQLNLRDALLLLLLLALAEFYVVART